MKTSSSFDASLAIANLSLSGTSKVNAAKIYERTLFSFTGFELSYNVALYDYSSTAFVSFYQLASSSMKTPIPFGRLAIGGSYHFIRMNGQRIVLDNQVEGRSWGVSPALELSVGLTRLTVEDPDRSNTQFTTAVIDMFPRLLFEIPLTPSFLLMVRAGYFFPIVYKNASAEYDIYYSGYSFMVGGKLATF